MSILVGGYFLAKHFGGSGILLGGVPGRAAGQGGGAGRRRRPASTPPAWPPASGRTSPSWRWTWSGCASWTSRCTRRTRFTRDEAHLLDLLPAVDLLIGAVLVPGAKAPRLIRRDMLRRMRPGSVLVDIAIDQGGCAETSRPTTHDDPVFVEEGVTHYCVANMPGAYARTATQALTNVTYRYIEMLADQRPGRGLPPPARAGRRHQRFGWAADQQSRGGSAWLAPRGTEAVAATGTRRAGPAWCGGGPWPPESGPSWTQATGPESPSGPRPAG